MVDNYSRLPYSLVSPMEQPLDKRLIGQWQGPTGIIELRSDYTAVANGEAAAWFILEDALTLVGASGTFQFPYQVTASTLTLLVNGQSVVFQRNSGKIKKAPRESGGIAADLAGKWNYLGGSTTYGGNTSSNKFLTLNNNGTYEYDSEYSVSGEAGSGVFQNLDRGTWSATETTLTLHSATQGSRTYALQKVNHPKNGDPMIVLDGEAYVTYYQKPGWC